MRLLRQCYGIYSVLILSILVSDGAKLFNSNRVHSLRHSVAKKKGLEYFRLWQKLASLTFRLLYFLGHPYSLTLSVLTKPSCPN